jgi:predicted nucleotidyltransferase
MRKQKEIEIIKKIIKESMHKNGILIKQIILFGSRAKGDFRKDSDWDFFVLVDKDLDFHGKWKIINEIKRKLAKLRIPNDIIIKSEKQFNIMKNDVGNISYYIHKEGMKL